MRKLSINLFLLIGIIFLSNSSFAQNVSIVIDSTPPVEQPIDTSVGNYYHPSEQQQYDNYSNIEGLVRYQDEQRAKRKRKAMLQIGIGVAGFAILIIGMMRKRKK